jgi:hypothetical protein
LERWYDDLKKMDEKKIYQQALIISYPNWDNSIIVNDDNNSCMVRLSYKQNDEPFNLHCNIKAGVPMPRRRFPLYST